MTSSSPTSSTSRATRYTQASSSSDFILYLPNADSLGIIPELNTNSLGCEGVDRADTGVR
jgi:hypothetical protein